MDRMDNTMVDMTEEERKAWLQERIDLCHYASAKLDKLREYFERVNAFYDERNRKYALRQKGMQPESLPVLPADNPQMRPSRQYAAR